VEDAHDPYEFWRAVTTTRNQRGDVLVAVANEIAIGVCQVIVFQHIHHSSQWCAELEAVHVDAAWRSRGVGGLLLAAAEAHAVSRGCYRLQLTSNLARHDAHRFYVAQGYRQSHLGFKKDLASPTLR
jgi:GNAT superfamily N-acetyltransferase